LAKTFQDTKTSYPEKLRGPGKTSRTATFFWRENLKPKKNIFLFRLPFTHSPHTSKHPPGIWGDFLGCLGTEADAELFPRLGDSEICITADEMEIPSWLQGPFEKKVWGKCTLLKKSRND